jgi:hypothetical protein
MSGSAAKAMLLACLGLVLAARELPVGPIAPVVSPQKPKLPWSWDRLPMSYHGADKNRTFNSSEIEFLAGFHLVTLEKWYTPCGAQGPVQAPPSCDEEARAETTFARIKAANPAVTTVLYFNSMFDFGFYAAHAAMQALEAAGTRAFLRDERGALVLFCNDGNVYCNITTFDWSQPAVRQLWIEAVENATRHGADGIYADHSAQENINIGAHSKRQRSNQLCNGGSMSNASLGHACYNFTAPFKASFNSWHTWGTLYAQDLLANTTGGPVICGKYANMGSAPRAGDFAGIRKRQAARPGEIIECGLGGHPPDWPPSESTLAAYLAAALPGAYLHLGYSGDDLLGRAALFPERSFALGAPNGTAQETFPGSRVWRRWFASGTTVQYDEGTKVGQIDWAGHPPTPTPTPPPTAPVPAVCGTVLQDTGMDGGDLGNTTVLATLGECCSACHDMAGCTIYSWHTEMGNTCHFHDGSTRPVGGKKGAFSGHVK